ncbi:unnamed protein product [Penicillium bialowiezense]
MTACFHCNIKINPTTAASGGSDDRHCLCHVDLVVAETWHLAGERVFRVCEHDEDFTFAVAVVAYMVSSGEGCTEQHD